LPKTAVGKLSKKELIAEERQRCPGLRRGIPGLLEEPADLERVPVAV
jgi:hypothetical protein